MFLTAAWFTFKRMPRILMLILLLISVFLLSFLLLGCSSKASTYSSIYLIRYQFNKSSSLYPLIKSSYKNKNLTNYENLKVTSGYLGLCIHLDDEITCTSKSDLSQFGSTSIPLYTSGSNSTSTQLDLVSLGSHFSNNINHPYILIATIVLTLILLLSLLYVAIPGLPAKPMVNKFNLALAPITTLIWGLGSMWAHVAQRAGKQLVEEASMSIVMAHIGRKAGAMTWTPFTFLCIVAIGVMMLHLRDLRRQIQEVDPKV